MGVVGSGWQRWNLWGEMRECLTMIDMSRSVFDKLCGRIIFSISGKYGVELYSGIGGECFGPG